ncbi:MAG TPA: hypothetical protein VMX74_09090 [Pirellulales bacterium]|nr:hypothetical protein [Pirellulales bacterium]
MTNFSEIVDAADNLSVDEQESLIGILRRRIAERNRRRLMREVTDARAEHKSGQSRPGAGADIMDEIRHES